MTLPIARRPLQLPFWGLRQLCLALSLCVQAWADCPNAASEGISIKKVEERLVLRLDDGRLVRLVGVDPALGTPDAPDMAESTRATLGAMLDAKRATLVSLGQPDRWGRVPGYVFLGGDAPAAGLSATLIAAGLGRYLPEPAAHACRDVLLSSERQARGARLGLWNDPYYAVLSVADAAAFAERSGTLVLAEGKLVAVQPSPFRTTLRFSSPDGISSGPTSHGGRMLVATIPPRIMKSFVTQSVDFRGLVGRSLRVRGLLDLRFGPQIELASPDDVEIADRTP